MESSKTPIAIIGMACRLPGSCDSPDKLWELLSKGRSAWSKIPESRFKQETLYHPNGEHIGTSHVQGGHFLEQDVAAFDASFYGYSAEVAKTLDPQIRMELECVYESMESAGISLDSMAGTATSVYAGAFFRDYHDSLMRDPDQMSRFLMTGNGAAMSSNRISHFYDLRGPSMTVDTGCSTTLTALHLACQDLKNGDSSMSVVCGANLMLNPDMFISMSSLGLLGKDGKSYAFDSRASGYGRGEGIAAIILKPLDQAIQDGDPIRAVIRQTLVNQDGRTPTLTSPSKEAQETLIKECYRRAGLDPLETGYLEAHGTGTTTGDPIEMGAAANVFGNATSRTDSLFVGSLKTNIGHTEATSGLASIIKVALALEKRQIPPSINFDQPNPTIHFDEWKLKVARKVEDFPAINGHYRASVNNFGYGGSNAHVILEAYQPESVVETKVDDNADALDSVVVSFSAKEEQGVRALTTQITDYAEANAGKANLLQDMAYTYGSKRSKFNWKSAVCAANIEELIDSLKNGKTKLTKGITSPRLGFIFTGQGAQWYAMGRELISAYPAFRASILEADKYLKEFGSSWSVIDELSKDDESTRVNEMNLSLPLCTTVQISLVNLLNSFGIIPHAVTGHSSGEVAAAYAAGAITFKSALAITFFRGTLGSDFSSSVCGKGGMIALGIGNKEAEKYIAGLTCGKVVVACINSQSSVTVSGDLPAILELEALCKTDEVFARRVKVEAAYHSHHMKAIEIDYLSSLSQSVTPRQDGHWGKVIYSSPTTGERETDIRRIGSASHWVQNMLQPVRFAESFQNMCLNAEGNLDVDVVLEVGPHGALKGPVQQLMTLPAFEDKRVPYLSCLTRKISALRTIQEAICQLIQHGCSVDMEAVNRLRHGSRVAKVLPNLPSYPWNHTATHWQESRINKRHRNRLAPSHDLLGCLALDSDLQNPKWRHVIRLDDIPWAREHTVQSDIVYPGAGFICMALEAMRQLAELQSPQKPIVGYSVSEVEILAALVIADVAEGTEVQITLRPASDKLLVAQNVYEFSISSVSGDDIWNEHCSGRIAAEFSANALASTSVEPLSESELTRNLEPEVVYKSMRSVGIYHGEVFQNISSITLGQTRSETHFAVADSASYMPNGYESPSIIHPTTLDSVFQAAYTVLHKDGVAAGNPMVPRSIKNMWISACISADCGHRFSASTRLVKHSSQGFETDVVISDDAAVIAIDGFKCQSLGEIPLSEADLDAKNVTFNVCWAPDINDLNAEVLQQRLSFAIQQEEVDILFDLKLACLYYIRRALQQLDETDIQQLEWFQRKYHDWMMMKVRIDDQDRLLEDTPVSSTEADQKLLRRVEDSSVNGQMVIRVGEKLLSILKHETTPLELMLEGKLLYRYYSEAIKWPRSYKQITALVDAFAHSKPDAKILEIGGGTGGCTKRVLKALETGHSSSQEMVDVRCASYDFTDISSGFFESARSELAQYGSIVNYRKLDIEGQVEEQGFELGTYDLIVACQVLHATKTIRDTMSNVRSLLKPGGKLLLIETTQDQIDLEFIFGLVPGWWLSSEDDRKWSPSLSVPMWQGVLEQTGFDGVAVELPDCDNENLYSFSVMMATASCPIETLEDDVVLVYSDKTKPPASWTKKIEAALQSLITGSLTTQCLEVDADTTGKTVIFLGEMGQTVLEDIHPQSFQSIKDLATKAKSLLWIGRGGFMDCERPHSSLQAGFLRTMRSEYPDKRFVSLDLDPMDELWSRKSIQTIANIVQRCFVGSQGPDNKDFEFAERNGEMHISRIYKDVIQNSELASTTAQLRSEGSFLQSKQLLRLQVGTPGLLDTLRFVESREALVELDADDCVEIEPRAFGLNFRDVMVALGQLDESVMGFECSGVVTRAGKRARQQGLNVGSRVCALLQGQWANRIQAHWHCVSVVPDHTSFEEAASIPMAFVTSYVSLFEAGRLRKGDSVLIHAASGGVGQGAIILAQHAGATVFATVGSDAKRQFLVENYGIPEDRIFSSRSAAFAQDIMRATNGRGVDVVLNSLAGNLLQQGFNCLSEFGRFVEIGKRDIEARRCLDMGAFSRSISFAAVDLIKIGRSRSDVVHEAMNTVMRLLNDERITTVRPIQAHPMDDMESVFRTMQSGKHIGKKIFTVTPSTSVSIYSYPAKATFCPDSTYMIVGGLGGIGKSLCKWFVERGVKSLVVTSRTKTLSKERSLFVQSLRKAGCDVVVPGVDVSNAAQLQRLFDDLDTQGKTIRGIIHAGMVLKDALLENMDVNDYKAAIWPKVQGSVSGSASQANYTAGGAFQDGLAWHRRTRGLTSTSIDLGIVESIGYVATEKRGIAERLTKKGYRALSEQQVLQVVEAAIANPDGPAQIITGINTSAGMHWSEQSWLLDDRFSALRASAAARQLTGQSAGNKSTSSVNGIDVTAALASVASFDDAVLIAQTAITHKISSMFLIDQQDIVPTQPLAEYGIDSLVAVELRTWLTTQIGAQVSVFDVMQSPSLIALASLAITKSNKIDAKLLEVSST